MGAAIWNIVSYPIYKLNHRWSVILPQITVVIVILNTLWRAYSNSNMAGIPLEINPSILGILLLMIGSDLLYVIWFFTKHIKMISVQADKLVIKRAVGAPVSTDLQEIKFLGNKLLIGRRLCVRLEEMDNLEKIKDLISPHVKVVRNDNQGKMEIASILRRALLVVLLTLFILLMPKFMENIEISQLFLWICSGVLVGMLVVVLGAVFKNLLVK